MQHLGILKPFGSIWPFRKQPSNFINVIRPFAKKNIENLLTTITGVTGIWKCRVFFGGGKSEYPAKNLSEQGREPAINSAHIWNRRWDLNPGHICERRVLSPLGQIQISIYWSITVCNTHLWMKVYFFRKNNETKNLSAVRRYLLHGLLL